jgi:glutathione S-transferase
MLAKRFIGEAIARCLFCHDNRQSQIYTLSPLAGRRDTFAAVMEGVRNAAAGQKGRAISGPHGYEQIPALLERSKQRVANFYGDLDSRLKDVPFVAGDHLSAADITALVTVDFATCAFAMPIPEDADAIGS